MMRNYYIFERFPEAWRMNDTVWQSRKDVIDAVMFLSREKPDFEFLVGYDDDKGILRIPDSISDVPEN